jgi:ATP-binding cassette subfamily B protein
MGPGGPRGGRPDEKSKNFSAAMIRIFRELSSLIAPTILAVLFATGGSVLMIIAPNIVSDLVDEISKGLYSSIDFDAVKSIATILGLMYVAGALATLFEGLLMAEISNRFAQKLRKRISRKINVLPLGYFDKNQTGDTLSRVTNDVDTISQSLSQSLSTLISEFVLFVGVAIAMFIINTHMAGVAVGASIIGFVFMGLIMSKSQKYFSMRQVELGKLNSHIEQIYSGLTVVKAYNGKNDSDKKFDKYNASVYEANRKSRFLGSLMHPIMNFISNLGYVAVCVTGAILVKNGSISIGTIVAFITYVRLFSSPLSNIAQSFTSLQSAAAASERVFEFLDSNEMPSEQGFIEKLGDEEIKGEIEFKNVKFGYKPDKLVIKNFSAKAMPGQKIAIVGPTGAGKTTLVNLLMKFYDINDGEIIIDGHSTRELKRSELHSLFTMVLQDTWMFEGTLRENIVYNRKNISDKRVMEVCDEVGLTHFVKTLPDGLDTKISETDSISSGQKQLITIARGMIEDSPFLILDEATSNVDTRTEELVQKAMDKLTQGRTSFVIAHRLSTIKNADTILVMKDGDIIESGNHKELMKKNGFYAELYNSQFAL